MRLNEKLSIERLGQRGEGVAAGPIFVPYALAGEEVIASVDGERGTLAEITRTSPDRIAAFCPAFTHCGGCAVQMLAPFAMAAWKRALVCDALKFARIDTEVAALVDAHGPGRRRATFHARSYRDVRGRLAVEVGFMQARAHTIVAIADCPLLAPSMAGALGAARAVAGVLMGLEKPLDIVVTATLEGLDLDFRGSGKLDFSMAQKLVALAGRLDIARLANHGAVIIERRAPAVMMGRARLIPPPGAFLQATELGEASLADLVVAAVGKARNVADLFAGVGTFTLRLAERASVHAVEEDASALVACQQAAHQTAKLKRVTIEPRDLFKRPLALEEIRPFDAVVFDPPRAGAKAQAEVLAQAEVPVVVAVSCNVQTFVRDAAILIGGGYCLERVTPIDQFRHSAHVEMVGIFTRKAIKAARRRGILS